jgi:AraC-like DNA-binding protein
MGKSIELQIAREILKDYKESLKKSYSEAPAEINSLLSHLNDNLFEKNISIQEIKNRNHSYNNNISTQFNHYVGLSPKQYILKHRLLVAKQILIDDELKNLRIVSIAIELGFSGNGAFNHAFKKEYGITPNYWRRSNTKIKRKK